MVVLSIIGVLFAAGLLYSFITYVNEYSFKKYSYEVFNWTTYFLCIVGYVMIYFGYDLYQVAVEKHQDVLNGKLLIIIGIMFVLNVVSQNMVKTSKLFGLGISIVQLVLYIPLALVGVFAVLVMFAYFSQTKPVYNIN